MDTNTGLKIRLSLCCILPSAPLGYFCHPDPHKRYRLAGQGGAQPALSQGCWVSPGHLPGGSSGKTPSGRCEDPSPSLLPSKSAAVPAAGGGSVTSPKPQPSSSVQGCPQPLSSPVRGCPACASPCLPSAGASGQGLIAPLPAHSLRRKMKPNSLNIGQPNKDEGGGRGRHS